MHKKLLFLFVMLCAQLSIGQTYPHVYSGGTANSDNLNPNFILDNFSTCQTSASLHANGYNWDGEDVRYAIEVNGAVIASNLNGPYDLDLALYLPVISVKLKSDSSSSFWLAINATVTVNSPLSTMPANGPTVSDADICDTDFPYTVQAGLNSGGVALKWYTAEQGGSPNFTAPVINTPGTYIYWVSQADAVGCESRRMQITINAAGAPTGAATQPFCSLTGKTLADLVVTGTSLKWYANAGILTQLPLSTALVNNVTYYVSQTVNGCETKRTAITITTLTATTFQADITCFGDIGSARVIAAGGTSPYSYLWSDGQLTDTATGLIPGSYSVTITDANSCSIVKNFTITGATSPIAVTTTAPPVCSGNATTLTVANADTYTWYSDLAGTNVVSQADTYTTPVLTADTDYYVQGHSVIPTSMVTPTAGLASPKKGIMFDITAAKLVKISSFDISKSGTGTSTISLYYRVGTYAGNENNSAAWTLAGSTTITNSSIITPVTVTGNISIPAGQTYGIYITSDAVSGSLVTGSIPNTFTDTNMTVGICVSPDAPFSNTIDSNRTFRGTIHYEATCSGPIETVNATVNELPVLTPSQTNVQCMGGTDGTATVVASGGLPTYTYLWSDGQTTATATGLAAGTYDVTVTDANNCSSAVQSFTIIELDTTNPIVTTQNITVQLDANGSVTILPTDVIDTANDNCSYIPTIDNDTFDCTNVGDNNVTVTVTDPSGNLATATAIVTVEDSIDPTVTPLNITVQLDANGSVTILPTDVIATANDNCSYIPTIDNDTFDCTNVGDNDVIVTVTDPSGNLATATAIVTVEDSIDPTVTPLNITVQLDANGSVTILPTDVIATANDNCSYIPTIDNDTFDCTNVGDNDIIVTVTDPSGNLATATAIVTVEDSIDPTVTPLNITVQLDANGSVTILPTDVIDTANDNCSYIPTIDNDTFDCTNVGDNNVTVTVTDPSGNLATATAIVTVEDSIDPTVTPLNITVQLDANGSVTILPTDVIDTANDNCSYIPTIDNDTFDCTNVGDNNVTVTVTDPSGNLATATAIVTVEDSIDPTVTPLNITVQLDANGSVTILPTDVIDTANDNCSYIPTIDNDTFDCTNVGDNDVIVTVTDPSGNLATATAIVTVEDSIYPTVTPLNITVQLDANGSVTILPTDVIDTANDNCSYIPTIDNDTFDCTNVGDNDVIVTVTDPSGNLATATAIVTVEDSIDPTVTPLNITVQLDANGSVTILPTDVIDTANDNCSYIPTIDNDTFDCTNVGDNNVTVTVTDPSGNLATATAIVTVEDSIDPTVTPLNITVQLDANGSVTILPTDVIATANDNCSYIPTIDNDTFDCTNLGDNDVIVTVTDPSGNLVTATSIVTVEDSIDPTLTAQDITVVLDGATGSVTITPADVIVTANDNCSYTPTLSNDTFNCTTVGSNTVTVTVTDPSGNLATATAVVTVQSTLAETPNTTQEDVLCFGEATGTATIALTGGSGIYNYLWSDGQTTQTATGLVAGDYSVVATDSNGCSVQHSFTITEPATPLTSSAIHTDVLCYNALTGEATITASGGTGAYTYHWDSAPVQTTATATGLHAGTYTAIVTDANGCASSQTIEITQPAAAVQVSVTKMNVSCFGNSNGTITVTATGGTGAYTYAWTPSVSTTNNATGLAPGNYVIAVTDANGCTATTTVNITQPPVLTGTVNVTNSDCSGFDNGTASVTVTGGTLPYTYAWSNGATTASVNSLTPGTYTVVVTDANNCTFTGTVSATEPPLITITSQPADYTTTDGNAIFTVTAVNGWAYLWHVSKDGGDTWELVENGGFAPHYIGAQTNTLIISSITTANNGYLYRARVFQIGTCLVYAEPALLTAENILATEHFDDLNMSIYPNPASTEVYVILPGFDLNKNIRFTMFDLNGRIVRESGIESETSKFDVGGLESGIYIINITSDKGTTTKKLVVDKKF